MTESEWLTCTEPKAMLRFFKEKSTARRLRLFLSTCCRRVWHLLTSHPAQAAIEASESFADGLVSASKLGEVAMIRWDAPVCVAGTTEEQAFHAVQAAARASHDDRFHAPLGVLDHLRIADPDMHARAHLLRDIIGNPFRPVSVESVWLTPTVTSLATAAYEERFLPSGELDPARLAVLADALEEAGCTNTDILTHLRGPGPHVRGCWVVDLLLGKE